MNSLQALQAENGLLDELWLEAMIEAYAAKHELQGSKRDVLESYYFKRHPEMKRWFNDQINKGTCEIAIYELQVERVHVGAKRRAERRVHDGPRPTPVAPNPALDWMKPFQSGPAEIKMPPGPDPLSGDFFAGREWCFADPALDYIAAVDKSTRAQACRRLHLILQEGHVRARGPLPSELVDVQDIDPEFWRHASPREEGDAVVPDANVYVAWFEVNVSDLCAAFPANTAPVLISAHSDDLKLGSSTHGASSQPPLTEDATEKGLSTSLPTERQTAPTRPKPHNKAVRDFFRDRVATWPDDIPAPSEADDIEAVVGHFEQGITREEIRTIRRDKEVTPAEWRKQGPRRPWGQVKPKLNPP